MIDLRLLFWSVARILIPPIALYAAIGTGVWWILADDMCNHSEDDPGPCPIAVLDPMVKLDPGIRAMLVLSWVALPIAIWPLEVPDAVKTWKKNHTQH
jgi:hypothetical protein